MSDIDFMEEEFETIMVDLDDGSTAEFAIVDDVEVEGQRYVLLSLILDDDTISEDPDDMVFMKDETDETCDDDEINLVAIETEEEYDKVVEAYTEDAE